jgi:hypothetical protein
MVQSAYAAAKNVERANATQRAVADALDAMATQFADQNARITTIGTATQSGIADALVDRPERRYHGDRRRCRRDRYVAGREPHPVDDVLATGAVVRYGSDELTYEFYAHGSEVS